MILAPIAAMLVQMANLAQPGIRGGSRRR